jgi:hypothetical protein
MNVLDSEYLDPFLKDSDGALIRKVEYLSSKKMLISHLNSFFGTASKPSIDIKVRVLFSKSVATFHATVTVYSDTLLNNSIYSGVSASMPLITNYQSFVAKIYDST